MISSYMGSMFLTNYWVTALIKSASTVLEESDVRLSELGRALNLFDGRGFLLCRF